MSKHPEPTGLQTNTYYRCKVQLYENNMEHEAIFYSGFVDKEGKPGGYACIMEPTYDYNQKYVKGKMKVTIGEKLFSWSCPTQIPW